MLNRLPQILKQASVWVGIPLSASIAVLASWLSGPGMELDGLVPNWPLIWVVCWSLQRSAWQGTIAGIALGFLQDSLTRALPTHAIGLAIVGWLTARLQKQRYMQEDFISVALIVFGMVVVAETVMALQWTLFLSMAAESPESGSLDWSDFRTLDSIWSNHQRITLTSAILTSLWAPVVHVPLSRWWSLHR